MKGLFKALLSVVFAWLSLGAASAQQEAQPSSLTLQQAVNIALEKNPLRQAAIADTKAASAGVREARSFLMPHLSFSEAATRGDDPVYVFGSKLRQQRFTSADFALNKLNSPLPFGNFTTRFGGSWNLFDSFATWQGVNLARQMNEAAGHQLDRTDQEIVFRVVSSYYEVLLAAKELEVAEQSTKTAHSIMDRSRARFDSGLTVESDLLTAKVRMATRQQEVIRARNTLEVARAQLNTAMGMPLDSPFQLTGELAERTLSVPAMQDAEKLALTNRPDLKRIASEEQAQRRSVSVAKSSFGPRVNAFAGWEMDSPTFVAGGGGNNWLGGIEVQFDIFQGGSKRAELSRQRALEEKVIAMKQAANDAVRLEVRRAYYETDANRQQVEVARAAIAQAQESLRINQDRYDSGLTTITDLLGAEDAARRSQTDYWEAVYHFQTSYANLELASGSLTGDAMNRMNAGLRLFLLVLVVVSLAGCSSEKTHTVPSPETVRNVPVLAVQQAGVPDLLEAVGTVRAAQTSDASSQMMGNIVEIRAHEGDHVQRGQVLAVIDDSQPRAVVDRSTAADLAAQQQLVGADSDLALAESTLKRYQNLYEKKSVSPQEFDEVKARQQAALARRDMAKAGHAQAQAALSQARTSLDYTRIRAPFDGVVTEKKADSGTLASPGMPIFTVEDVRRYRLEATVNENDLQYVRTGEQVSVVVDALDNARLKGKVVQIVPAADAASRTFLVKIDLPTDTQLRSGLFGRAQFSRGERQALLIPRSAVVERGQLQGIYVLDQNKVASLRYITLGKPSGAEVEVLAGLQDGERLVAKPGAVDLNGKRIEVQ